MTHLRRPITRRRPTLYANGEGVLKDEAEAVRWFRLAAEQGDALAQSNLGAMYANGRGVLKDPVQHCRRQWARRLQKRAGQP